MAISRDKIRNFSIIAHIDHGKSTLADRILEQTRRRGSPGYGRPLLDNMDLERERGITIKAACRYAGLPCQRWGGLRFQSDQHPGHVDFNYEASRAWRPAKALFWWWMLLSGDRKAQTLANTYLAVDAGACRLSRWINTDLTFQARIQSRRRGNSRM